MAKLPALGGGYYLAHDMGVGKSYIVVVYIANFDLRRTLIVCPTSVIGEWPGQFTRHGDGKTTCLPLRGGSVAKRLKVAQDAYNSEENRLAIVVNFEAAWRKPFGDWALSQKWDMIVADEGHRLKAQKSQVSLYFAKLTAATPRRLALSGTPIPNTPMDLWAQMRFLDPRVFGLNYFAFRSQFAVMGGFKDREVVAFRNLDVMNQKFYSVAHRVTKAECLDLPPSIDEERIVTLGAKAEHAYIEIEEEFIARIEEGEISVPNALTELLRLQQVTGGAVTLNDGSVAEIDTGKMLALKEIMEDLESNEPIVVFCRFRHDLKAVHDAARAAGRKSAELSGKLKELDKWRDSVDISVLAVQISSGGVGVDMTKACYCVFYSLGFSLAEYLQARARLDRQGQTRSVTYLHLIARLKKRQTVDSRVYKAMEAKQNVVKSVLEDLT